RQRCACPAAGEQVDPPIGQDARQLDQTALIADTQQSPAHRDEFVHSFLARHRKVSGEDVCGGRSPPSLSKESGTPSAYKTTRRASKTAALPKQGAQRSHLPDVHGSGPDHCGFSPSLGCSGSPAGAAFSSLGVSSVAAGGGARGAGSDAASSLNPSGGM